MGIILTYDNDDEYIESVVAVIIDHGVKRKYNMTKRLQETNVQVLD